MCSDVDLDFVFIKKAYLTAFPSVKDMVHHSRVFSCIIQVRAINKSFKVFQNSAGEIYSNLVLQYILMLPATTCVQDLRMHMHME